MGKCYHLLVVLTCGNVVANCVESQKIKSMYRALACDVMAPVKHCFLPHVLTVNYTKLYKMCGKKMVGSITISETQES